jgi:hypothetical protein
VIGLAEIVEEGAADLVQAGHERLKSGVPVRQAAGSRALHSAVFSEGETDSKIGAVDTREKSLFQGWEARPAASTGAPLSEEGEAKDRRHFGP